MHAHAGGHAACMGLYKMRGDAVAYMVTTCYGARPDLSRCVPNEVNSTL